MEVAAHASMALPILLLRPRRPHSAMRGRNWLDSGCRSALHFCALMGFAVCSLARVLAAVSWAEAGSRRRLHSRTALTTDFPPPQRSKSQIHLHEGSAIAGDPLTSPSAGSPGGAGCPPPLSGRSANCCVSSPPRVSSRASRRSLYPRSSSAFCILNHALDASSLSP